MRTAKPSVLKVAYAALSAFGQTAPVPFDVHTGRASGDLPYVVLGTQDVESPTPGMGSKTDRDTAPTDVLFTARAYGLGADAALVAAQVADHVGAWPHPWEAALSAEGFRLMEADRPTVAPLPRPADASDTPVYGERVTVRLTLQNTA